MLEKINTNQYQGFNRKFTNIHDIYELYNFHGRLFNYLTKIYTNFTINGLLPH